MATEAKTLLLSNKTGKQSGHRQLKVNPLRAYCDQKEKTIDDERIVRLLPMVPHIANKVTAYLKPPLSFDDLIAAGTVGLVKAARDYDPSRQAEFKTYAYIRIRGAILDELKKWTFVTPEMNKKITEAGQAAVEFRQSKGFEPTDEQLAEKLGVNIDKVNEIFAASRARSFLSIDASNDNPCPLSHCLLSDKENTPDENIEQAELIDQLAEAIQELPKNKRHTVIMYYQQNLTMKQIAELLNITESRVSQLHASALFTLSLKLRKWKNAG